MNMRQTFYEFCMLHERTNLLKEWDESRNFPLTPDTVSYGSKKKVRWTCENGHSWQTTVHVRSEGSGCPLAFQVLDAACAVINDMATFDEAGINDDYLDEIRRGDQFTP